MLNPPRSALNTLYNAQKYDKKFEMRYLDDNFGLKLINFGREDGIKEQDNYYTQFQNILPSQAFWHNYGIKSLLSKNYKKAEFCFKKVLAFNNKSPLAYLYLGYTSHLQKTYDSAKEYYLTAIKLQGEFPISEFNLALIYLENGQKARATEIMGKYRSFAIKHQFAPLINCEKFTINPDLNYISTSDAINPVKIHKKINAIMNYIYMRNSIEKYFIHFF